MPLKFSMSPEAGEYAYCDDGNEVICRMEARQVEKTKVQDKTTNVFFIVQGNEETPEDDIKSTAQRLAELITRFLGGRYEAL